MRAIRLIPIVGGFLLLSAAGFVLQREPAVAATSTAVPTPAPSAVAAATCAPRAPMPLAIAFTTNVADTTPLHLALPWGKAGDPEGRMVEDYGAFDGTSIREELPVYDISTGSLQILSGHNAIDIVLDSGTPLYAVTSGTVYANHDWTIPGGVQGYAAILISDTLRDDKGEPVAFLYGHVREFDTQNWQHVEAGTLIAKSGGGDNDPGRGFSDMPNVHFEVIESPHPLAKGAGTVNPHQFLENLYTYAALTAQHPGC